MGRADITGGVSSHVGNRTDARCPRCYDMFPCGASAASCWCQTLPPLDFSRLPAALVGTGCHCASCLQAAIRAEAAQ